MHLLVVTGGFFWGSRVHQQWGQVLLKQACAPPGDASRGKVTAEIDTTESSLRLPRWSAINWMFNPAIASQGKENEGQNERVCMLCI